MKRIQILLYLLLMATGCSEQDPEPVLPPPGFYTALWVTNGLSHSLTLEVRHQNGLPTIDGENTTCDLRREIYNRGGYRDDSCSLDGAAVITDGRILATFATRSRGAFTLDASSNADGTVLNGVLNGTAFGGDALAVTVRMVRGVPPFTR